MPPHQQQLRHLIGGEEVVFLYGSRDAVMSVHHTPGASYIREAAVQINGVPGVVRARPNMGGAPAPTLIRSVADALRLPTRPLGGGGAQSLMGGPRYPLKLVDAPVTIRLLVGPGAAAVEYDAPLVLVVPDDYKVTDWEMQLGDSFNEHFRPTQMNSEGLRITAPARGAGAGAGAGGAPAGCAAAATDVPYIAPRRGALETFGTSTFMVAQDTMDEAKRAAAERAARQAAADAARAAASGGTRFHGADVCAQCGAGRGGATGVKLRACTGCQDVLQVFYCGADCQLASWGSGHKDACRRAQAARAR